MVVTRPTATPIGGQPGLFLVRGSGSAWTSSWMVLVATADVEAATAAVDGCFAEIRRLERVLSEWVPDSEISKVNAAAGSAPVTVTPELRAVIEKAIEVGTLTAGGFDLTFLPLGRLWRLKDKDFVPPAAPELARARALVDFNMVAVDAAASTVFIKRAEMRIGLGGIGQGVAVDRCVALLREAGQENFIVDGSGDVFVSGAKGSVPWRAGIAHPRNTDAQFAVFIPPSGAMVTSGDYERFAIHEGKRYHHIIDPATGYPVTHTASVTVFAPTTTFADALSTGLFVMGSEKGMSLVESRPDMEAVFVDIDGAVHVSSGLGERIDVPTKKIDMGAGAGLPPPPP